MDTTTLTAVVGAISAVTAVASARPNLVALAEHGRRLIHEEDRIRQLASPVRGADRQRKASVQFILDKTPELFRADMRVTRPTFDFLVEELEPFLQVRQPNGRRKPGKPRVDTTSQVLVTLYYLATGMSHRTVANTFEMAEQTVTRVIYDVVWAILDRFQEQEIRMPTEEDDPQNWHRLRFGFASGPGHMPNCIGAVDGMHIGIKAPPKTKTNPRAYYNYKQFYSVVLQGTVSASMEFLDVDVGWPGSTSDARIWLNSEVYRHVIGRDQNTGILPDYNFVIGDKIYELTERMLTPFRGSDLSHAQRRFNKRIAQARAIVERAFAMLKGRFRCLSDREFEVDYCHVAPIALACTVLHNICLRRHEPLPYEDYENYFNRSLNIQRIDFHENLLEERNLLPGDLNETQLNARLGLTIPIESNDEGSGEAFREKLAEMMLDDEV